ncbi:MAG: hypothetical protein QM759_08380 [Terricaulis sp.]
MAADYVCWCVNRARRALRTGDLDTAERWYKIADKAQLIEQRRQRIEQDAKRPVHQRFAGR